MTGRTVLRVAEEDADGNVIIPLTEEQAAFFLAPGGVFAVRLPMPGELQGLEEDEDEEAMEEEE